MYSMLIFFAIACITGIDAAEHCDKNLKQGPFYVEDVKVPDLHEKLVPNARLSICTTNSEQNIIVGYLAYHQSYAYQGSALDPNTRVEESLVNINLTREELMDWSSKGKCETGPDYVDEWGSDSDKCLKVDRHGHWHERKELIRRNNNNHFAHHTCNRSWRCGISIEKIPAILECDHEECWARLVDTSGKTIEISENLVYNSKGVSMLLKEKPSVKCMEVQHTCIISKDSNRIECIHDGKAIEVLSSGYTCLHEKCWKMVEYKDHNPKPVWDNHDSGKPATIGDLKAFNTWLHGENAFLKYNVELLAQHLEKHTNMFHKLVLSLAKIDDRLLGNLLEKKMSSEFVSDKYFVLFPCISPKSPDSNCFNGSIYREGRWVSNVKEESCFALNKSRPISLEKSIDLWIPEIGSPTIHHTYDSYTGWSFVANQRDNLIDTMVNTKYGGTTTSLQDVLSLPVGGLNNIISGFTISTIFSYLLCFVMGFFIMRVFCRVM